MRARKPTARRRYDASRRQASAAERRLAIVVAARRAFEEQGWAGTRVRAIAEAGGVSQKLVEALFHTKATLLEAAVEFAIRGDIEPLPMPQRHRVGEMERAPDAATLLRLHARHVRLINARSARIAAVVEQAAPADAQVAALWKQMNENRAHATTWATETLFKKPGRRPTLRRQRAQTIFWVGLDWGTYRTLTDHARLDDKSYETWLNHYYRDTLLPPRTCAGREASEPLQNSSKSPLR